jgi:hypothetical protein
VEPLLQHELDSVNKELTTTVNEINEALEELRYALADLSEEKQ